MIDQIILAFLDSLWRTKIHSILLTNFFDLFPGAREAHYCGVEFGEVGLQDAGGIAGRVAGYEQRKEGRERGWRFRGEEGRSVDDVYHLGHFVEFFRADVGTVGETEVYLSQDSH